MFKCNKFTLIDARVRAHNSFSFKVLVPVKLEEGGDGLPEHDHDEGHEGERNKLKKVNQHNDLLYMDIQY